MILLLLRTSLFFFFFFFFFNDTATTEIYTLSLHDALPICLSKLAGRPVVVENRPGAQGALASDVVAKAKPDGYTLMITPASSTIATAPYLFKQLPFDPKKDFAPVTTISSLSFVFAVDAAGPLQSIPDLIAHLKQSASH